MNLKHATSISKELSRTQTLLLLLSFVFLTAACEPKDVRPGLWLQGEEVANNVADWSFTDDVEEILIETQPWYQLSHSTTIWCVQFENELYVGSYGSEKKFWEENLQRDPHARISINGKIYKVLVSKLQDEALTREIGLVYNRKYDMAEVFGDDIPDWWFYRVEQER